MKRQISLILYGITVLLFSLFVAEAGSTTVSNCDQDQVNEAIQRLDQLGDEELSKLSDCGSSIVHRLIRLLEDSNPEIASRAADALRFLGTDAKTAVPALIQTLQDTRKSNNVRARAADALGAIRPGDQETVAALFNVLGQNNSPDIRSSAVFALVENSKATEELVTALEDILDNQFDEESVRANAAYALGELTKDYLDVVEPLIKEDLIKVIQDPNQPDRVVVACLEAIDQLEVTDAVTISALIQVLKRPNISVHQFSVTALVDISRQLYNQSEILQEVNSKEEQVKQIQDVLHNLNANNEPYIQKARQDIADILKDFSLKRQNLLMTIAQRWVIGDRAIWIGHPLFWLFLVFVYPKFPQIQAIFFWNKYVREIFGFGYVGFLLTWIPLLRCRLFAPFKDSLLADAKLDSFELQSFFSQAEVKLKDANHLQSVQEVLPEIKGQVILEGESGLGKTMMLRHLVSQSKRITVYLPAQKCENGVIEAIQAKLHGQAQDADFLKNLIYSGAIDICIDGLNEVKPDVRANIKAFVESYFKGNIIMTTQPLLWNPPSTAKTYVLQPLHRNQIEQFLHLCEHRLPSDSKLHGTGYRKACTQFLAHALSDQSDSDDSSATRRILSNPMDLTIVAQMIGSSVQPDLFHLQEQQYELMAEDYERSWNQPFPLKQFSEFVYQMRDKDEYAMTGESFYQTLTIMEKEQHRMVLSRQWKDKDGNDKQEWSFRHDKIMEFFIVQNFMSSGSEGTEKRKKHMGDPRFRGIYLLLAQLLPLNDALKLREDLIQYAADTQDHTVSDAYVQLMRSRC